jgi:hypothetical protein
MKAVVVHNSTPTARMSVGAIVFFRAMGAAAAPRSTVVRCNASEYACTRQPRNAFRPAIHAASQSFSIMSTISLRA